MRRRIWSVWSAVLVPCAVGLAGGTAGAQGTWRVSLDSTGAEGDADSYRPSISGNGRFVAFDSDATNLVSGDTNGFQDVFVHDRRTGTTTRVSLHSAGDQGNGRSSRPSISADGRFVAFESDATNLVSGDRNWARDVFVHDRQTGVTTRVSVDSAGSEGDSISESPSISGDGRFVAFHSYATNLVPSDTNQTADIFVHDRQNATTTLISVNGRGVHADSKSQDPVVSADGGTVAYESWATNLVVGDTNGGKDVFVHDRQSRMTIRASVASSGAEADWESEHSSISADGRFVAFESRATNLVPGDTNGFEDVFVHDGLTRTTVRVSVDAAGAQGDGSSYSYPSCVSGDGRFVAFESWSTNLVSGDTNQTGDIFVHDLLTGTTTRVSVDSTGAEAGGYSRAPSISGDGRFVAFQSRAWNLVPGDTNSFQDVFVHGRYLTLEALPEIVTTGATLTFTTWWGQYRKTALLAAVAVNGTPGFAQLQFGKFDYFGFWAVSGTVPPGLSGNTVTFQVVGQTPMGAIDLSNPTPVTFQ